MKKSQVGVGWLTGVIHGMSGKGLRFDVHRAYSPHISWSASNFSLIVASSPRPIASSSKMLSKTLDNRKHKALDLHRTLTP